MANIYINTDHYVEVMGVEKDGTFSATATITVELRNADTEALIMSALSVPNVVATDPTEYRAVIADTVLTSALTCVQCRADFVLDDGAGYHREWSELYDIVYDSFAVGVFADETDHTLTVTVLVDTVTGGGSPPITGATVQVTLNDLSDNPISGQVWPTTLVHSAGGTYSCNLADTLDVDPGDAVKVILTADNGAGYYHEWRSVLTVQSGT